MLETANLMLTRLKEKESELSDSLSKEMNEIRQMAEQIEDHEKKQHEIYLSIRELQKQQTNKVTAFGGDRVINLLRAIETHHHKFQKPPIGPIGAHLTLVNGDLWAPAVENAIGKLLNAFIVTDHKDSLLLRGCAGEVNYNHLQIIIYDFSKPRLNIPHNMLPQTQHLTTLSVIHSDNHTVVNALVDMGGIERQVLVKDYNVGKAVTFEQRTANLKEVFTLDGYKMFSRGSVQTILPPNKRARTGRLCSSLDDQIKNFQIKSSHLQEQVLLCCKRKRDAEVRLQDLNGQVQSIKRRRLNAEREMISKKRSFQDVKSSYVTESSNALASASDKLHWEISKVQDEIHEKEKLS